MQNPTWNSYFLILLAYMLMSSPIVMADQFNISNNEDIAEFYTEKAMKNIHHKRYELAEQDINNGLEKITPQNVSNGCQEQEDCQNNFDTNSMLLAELFSIRALTREFRGLHHAAISDYEKSLMYNRNSVDNKYSLAILYFKHNKCDEALLLLGQIKTENTGKANSLKEELDLMKSVRDLQKNVY